MDRSSTQQSHDPGPSLPLDTVAIDFSDAETSPLKTAAGKLTDILSGDKPSPYRSYVSYFEGGSSLTLNIERSEIEEPYDAMHQKMDKFLEEMLGFDAENGRFEGINVRRFISSADLARKNGWFAKLQAINAM